MQKKNCLLPKKHELDFEQKMPRSTRIFASPWRKKEGKTENAVCPLVANDAHLHLGPSGPLARH